MGLSQDIVIVNEFTTTNVKTLGKGTRGATPGDYVLRYMARQLATETLAPVQLSEDDVFKYTTRYMAREEATEQMIENNGTIGELKQNFGKIDKLSGVGFGTRGISLSDRDIKESAAIIQEAFENKHAVAKTIFSFTEDYLREHGIIRPGFVFAGRGSYRGNIDQLKLRKAVMDGVDAWTKKGRFVDPMWVGVIQVDTAHVHIHVACCDTEFSPFRMVEGGWDRGSISRTEKRAIRMGIHKSFDSMKTMNGFHAQLDTERRNVVSYVKDFAYAKIKKNTPLQLLIASLPKDSSMWRYGTNRMEMQHTNNLAREFVESIFEQQPVRSGYDKAMLEITKYAKHRSKLEDLTYREEKLLVQYGRDLLIERSVNGLYSVIKDIPEHQRMTATTMIDIQSRSEEELLSMIDAHKETVNDSFDTAGFALRVRGFGSRRKEHLKSANRYYESIKTYDAYHDEGKTGLDSLALRRFYETELLYNMALCDKYRYFFKFNLKEAREQKEEMMPAFETLMVRYDELSKQNQLINDSLSGELLKKLGVNDSGEALSNINKSDKRIKELYGVSGGTRIFSDSFREILIDEIDISKRRYISELRDYAFECFKVGVGSYSDFAKLVIPKSESVSNEYLKSLIDLNLGYDFLPPVMPQTVDEMLDDDKFNEVKAKDVHHLGLDFYGKLNHDISPEYAIEFVDTTIARETALAKAIEYLDASNQDKSQIDDVIRDIEDMREVADIVIETYEIPTATFDDTLVVDRLQKTISSDVSVDVAGMIANTTVDIESDLENLDIHNSGRVLDDFDDFT